MFLILTYITIYIFFCRKYYTSDICHFLVGISHNMFGYNGHQNNNFKNNIKEKNWRFSFFARNIIMVNYTFNHFPNPNKRNEVINHFRRFFT